MVQRISTQGTYIYGQNILQSNNAECLYEILFSYIFKCTYIYVFFTIPLFVGSVTSLNNSLSLARQLDF